MELSPFKTNHQEALMSIKVYDELHPETGSITGEIFYFESTGEIIEILPPNCGNMTAPIADRLDDASSVDEARTILSVWADPEICDWCERNYSTCTCDDNPPDPPEPSDPSDDDLPF